MGERKRETVKERERKRWREYENWEGKEKSLKNRCAKIVCLQWMWTLCVMATTTTTACYYTWCYGVASVLTRSGFRNHLTLSSCQKKYQADYILAFVNQNSQYMEIPKMICNWVKLYWYLFLKSDMVNTFTTFDFLDILNLKNTEFSSLICNTKNYCIQFLKF